MRAETRRDGVGAEPESEYADVRDELHPVAGPPRGPDVRPGVERAGGGHRHAGTPERRDVVDGQTVDRLAAHDRAVAVAQQRRGGRRVEVVQAAAPTAQ